MHDPRLTPARPDLAAKYLEGKVQAARFVEGETFEVHETIARVTDDIDRRFVFNTPVAAVMELLNELTKTPEDPAARFDTMAAFCAELEACLAELRVTPDLDVTNVLPAQPGRLPAPAPGGDTAARRSPPTYRDRRSHKILLCALCAPLGDLRVEKCGAATKSGVAGESPNPKRQWRYTHRASTQRSPS